MLPVKSSMLMTMLQSRLRRHITRQPQVQDSEGKGVRDRHCGKGGLHDVQEGDPGHDPDQAEPHSGQGALRPRRASTETL